MGDAHEMIVHDIGKVVGRHTVGFEQDAVLDVVRGDGDVAVDHVGVGGHHAEGHLLPDDELFARRRARFRLRERDVAALPVVGVDLAVPEAFEALLRAEAVVRAAALDELLGVLLVDVRALALDVGSDAAVAVGSLVVIQARRGESAVDHLLRSFHRAFAVGVLYPEDELPAAVACEKIGVKPRAQVAYVHKARGRWREPRAYRLRHDPSVSS